MTAPPCLNPPPDTYNHPHTAARAAAAAAVIVLFRRLSDLHPYRHLVVRSQEVFVVPGAAAGVCGAAGQLKDCGARVTHGLI